MKSQVHVVKLRLELTCTCQKVEEKLQFEGLQTSGPQSTDGRAQQHDRPTHDSY